MKSIPNYIRYQISYNTLLHADIFGWSLLFDFDFDFVRDLCFLFIQSLQISLQIYYADV